MFFAIDTFYRSKDKIVVGIWPGGIWKDCSNLKGLAELTNLTVTLRIIIKGSFNR